MKKSFRKPFFMFSIMLSFILVACSLGTVTGWKSTTVSIQIPSLGNSSFRNKELRAIVGGNSYLYIASVQKGNGETLLHGPYQVEAGKEFFTHDISANEYDYIVLINSASPAKSDNIDIPDFGNLSFKQLFETGFINYENKNFEGLAAYFFTSATSIGFVKNVTIKEGRENKISAKLAPLTLYNIQTISETNGLDLNSPVLKKDFIPVLMNETGFYEIYSPSEQIEEFNLYYVALYDYTGKLLTTEVENGIEYIQDRTPESFEEKNFYLYIEYQGEGYLYLNRTPAVFIANTNGTNPDSLGLSSDNPISLNEAILNNADPTFWYQRFYLLEDITINSNIGLPTIMDSHTIYLTSLTGQKTIYLNGQFEVSPFSLQQNVSLYLDSIIVDGGNAIFNAPLFVLGGFSYGLSIINSTIRKVTYSGTGFGGAIAVMEGTLNLYEGSVIEENTAYNGAGIYVNGLGKVVIYGGIIRRNLAQNSGGGIYLNSGASLAINEGANFSIANNTAIFNGGGIYREEFSTIEDPDGLLASSMTGNIPDNTYWNSNAMSVD